MLATLLPLFLALPALAFPAPNVTSRGLLGSLLPLELDVTAGTCIRLGADVNIAANVAHTAADVELDAGVCICVDAAASVGLGGISADVIVSTSAGIFFQGDVASKIGQAVQYPRSAAASAFAFVVADTCTALTVGLSATANTHHTFLPGPGGCCKRACNPGYTMSRGRCIPNPPPPTCPPNKILCNGNCYDAATYTCPSGVPTRKNRRRALSDCPTGLRRCEIPGWSGRGTQGSGEGTWECIDVKRDIESCGGCAYSTSLSGSRIDSESLGMDCTAIPNVNEVSCLAGSCAVRSCLKGYLPSEDNKSCQPSSIAFKIQS